MTFFSHVTLFIFKGEKKKSKKVKAPQMGLNANVFQFLTSLSMPVVVKYCFNKGNIRPLTSVFFVKIENNHSFSSHTQKHTHTKGGWEGMTAGKTRTRGRAGFHQHRVCCDWRAGLSRPSQLVFVVAELG